MGGERVGQRVVDGKVPHHKGGEGGFRESNQRGHRHLRCPLGPKIVQVQNAKVRERLAELVYHKQVEGNQIRPVKKSRENCGLSQQMGGNIKGHLGVVAGPTSGGKQGVILKVREAGTPKRGVL